MVHKVKNAIKKSKIYSLYLDQKNRKAIKSWNLSDEQSLKFYQQFINHGDLVFDVGANLGNRTKIFLKLQARVIAFEPQKVCYEFLEKVFSSNTNFRLVKEALGAGEGETEMLISSDHTLSTLSPDWAKLTKESGRFDQNWNKKQHVRISTLDKAIEKFGDPAFLKIDVEGYELEVLSGLTKPVKCISIEFAAETLGKTLKCIDHLSSLSAVEFQIAVGENKDFYLKEWTDNKNIKKILQEMIKSDKLAWGDVYIRMKK